MHWPDGTYYVKLIIRINQNLPTVVRLNRWHVRTVRFTCATALSHAYGRVTTRCITVYLTPVHPINSPASRAYGTGRVGHCLDDEQCELGVAASSLARQCVGALA